MSNRQIYDTVFRHYFNDPRRFLSLGNALLNTCITDTGLLRFNTLEGTFFSNLKNDISCLFGSTFLLVLEHQTTENRNMPFRLLCYAAELYQKFIADAHVDMYNPHLQKLPPPVFVVFYDNMSNNADHTQMHLSDAFGGDGRFLELNVDVYNIFGDANQGLKAKCDYLRQYGLFSTKHRNLRKSGLDGDAAIRETLKYCRENGIMTDYINEHESEVFRMLHNEWDSDAERIGYMNAGREEGIKVGEERGEERGLVASIKNLMSRTTYTMPQAMDLLGIPQERQQHFAMLLQG